MSVGRKRPLPGVGQLHAPRNNALLVPWQPSRLRSGDRKLSPKGRRALSGIAAVCSGQVPWGRGRAWEPCQGRRARQAPRASSCPRLAPLGTIAQVTQQPNPGWTPGEGRDVP